MEGKLLSIPPARLVELRTNTIAREIRTEKKLLGETVGHIFTKIPTYEEIMEFQDKGVIFFEKPHVIGALIPKSIRNGI